MKEGWEDITLGDVCEIVSGKNQKLVQNPNGKYPIYGSGGIFGYADDYLCEPGTTIIGRKGTINSPIYVNEKFWNVDTAFGISPKRFIDTKYNYYFCLGFNFKKLDKSTTIPSLAKRDLLKIKYPLAPLPEQRAIVQKLEVLFSDLDQGVADLKKAQEQLQVYRQALVKKVYEKIGKFEYLGNCGEWKGGGTPSKRVKEYWEEGDVLWVSSRDIKTKEIHDTERKITKIAIENSSTKWIEKDALLFVMRSGILRRIFPIAIAKKRLCVNQDIQTLTLKDGLSPEYVYWFLTGNESDIRHNCSKDGTTVESIDANKLKEFKIPICTIEEQHQIVKKIESRLSVCDALEQTISEGLQKSQALRQSLLKKAFEGSLLSPQELEACKAAPDWEPAAVLLEKIKKEKNT